MENIKLPYSTMKRLLVSNSDFRAKPESVAVFTEKILNYASELSNKIVEITKTKNRKTICSDDVLDALNVE